MLRESSHHGHDAHARLRDSPSGRLLLGAAGALALFAVVGLVALWPGQTPGKPSAQAATKSGAATVRANRLIDCPTPTPQRCRQIDVDIDGSRARITLGPLESKPPDPQPGSRIRVAEIPTVPGEGALPADAERYTYVGSDRSRGLLALGVLVLVVALVVVRLRGLLAAVGVGISLWLVVAFVVPAILDGRPALLVALVGSLAVTFVTVLLTNGLTAQSLAAILGIGSTLLATCAGAALAVHALDLDGRYSELSLFLAQSDSSLSLQGIVLAGMVIGAVGVLTDTAVTQASAVMALRRADPTLTAGGLYRSAITVGRDHLSATIHTLVLAYVGTTLPLLLLLRSTGVPAADAISMQDVAEPMTAALVGCLALVVAVPVTTALAATLVARTPPEALRGAHAHPH